MNNTKGTIEGALFVQLIGFVAFIAFILLTIDQNGANFHVDLIFCLNCLVAESSMNCVYCYCCDLVSSRFYEIGDVAYETIWHKFSISEQKFIRRTIERSQIRMKLTGCKMFVCSMETFLDVFLAEKVDVPINYFSFSEKNLFKLSLFCLS